MDEVLDGNKHTVLTISLCKCIPSTDENVFLSVLDLDSSGYAVACNVGSFSCFNLVHFHFDTFAQNTSFLSATTVQLINI